MIKLNKTNDYSITPLGKKKITVYDLEVDKYHNFFANRILVHNSNYVKLEHIVEQAKKKGLKEDDIIDFMDKFCQKVLAPEIEKAYDQLKENMNAFEQKMFMKREALASDVVWTGKKRYAMLVWDFEGVRYHSPQLKVTGIEAVRSSTPKACREKIEEALYIVLGGKQEELWEFIKQFRQEFPSLPFRDITFNVSINNLEVYHDPSSIYRKGTPIYTRGALLYNHYIEKYDIADKYQRLQNGDKAHYIYLRVPNPIQENIITVADNIPEEFGLTNFIDYDMQFEKSFLSPLKTIVDAAGWTLEKTNTLDSFFI